MRGLTTNCTNSTTGAKGGCCVDINKEITFSDARAHLSEIANEVAYGGKRAVLTRRGEKFVAIVSIEDLEALQLLEEKIDIEDVKKSYAFRGVN
jgi:prevent-host-death family protein